MATSALLKAVVAWFLLVILAIANGILRDKVLTPALGSPIALPFSGMTLSLFILLVAWFSLPWYGALPSSRYWLIGLLWLLMTILFEFGFGYFVAHKSWAEMLQAYNVVKGNLWVMVLAATFVSPWLAARLRGYL